MLVEITVATIITIKLALLKCFILFAPFALYIIIKIQGIYNTLSLPMNSLGLYTVGFDNKFPNESWNRIVP